MFSLGDRSEERAQQDTHHGSRHLPSLDASNFLAIGLAFFVLMGGLMLVMMGAVSGMDNKKKDSDHAQAPTQIVREIVKVRCKYCNALNFETSQRCSNCGGQL